MRVDMPHDVVKAGFLAPSSSVNSIPIALEKFVPRKCDVPDCSALPSCIIASIVRLETAPGKRSASGFSPSITGIASISSAKSR